MARSHTIRFAGASFHARSGQRLLDAAMAAGVDLPHDCRAGRCGACLTRVRSGATLGGETSNAGMVHACQAMVFTDIDIEVEQLPPVETRQARVIQLNELADDIVEVVLRPTEALQFYPGQYVKLKFRGFPARAFSPTATLGARLKDVLHFHIKRVQGGRVTPQLGAAIKKGHAVTIEGPFGHAFLRRGLRQRLVLVGSGTGFAPIWAVAAAALLENPYRAMTLIAASRSEASFYMTPALRLLSPFPNVKTISSVRNMARVDGVTHAARAIECVPMLTPRDIVYAAGAPGLVDAVEAIAARAGATFYSDPFKPSGDTAMQDGGWLATAKAWLSTAA